MAIPQTAVSDWWFKDTGYNCRFIIGADSKLNGKIRVEIK